MTVTGLGAAGTSSEHRTRQRKMNKSALRGEEIRVGRCNSLCMTSLMPLAAIMIGGAVLAVLMLHLQHRYWMSKRLTELRLEAISQINWLLAQFLTNYMNDQGYVPSRDFLHSFRAATSKAQALFSDGTWQVFTHIERMVAPNLGTRPGDAPQDVTRFLEAQDAALRALYREVGLRIPEVPPRLP